MQKKQQQNYACGRWKLGAVYSDVVSRLTERQQKVEHVVL